MRPMPRPATEGLASRRPRSKDRIVVGKLVERDRTELTANLAALNADQRAELLRKLAPQPSGTAS